MPLDITPPQLLATLFVSILYILTVRAQVIPSAPRKSSRLCASRKWSPISCRILRWLAPLQTKAGPSQECMVVWLTVHLIKALVLPLLAVVSQSSHHPSDYDCSADLSRTQKQFKRQAPVTIPHNT